MATQTQFVIRIDKNLKTLAQKKAQETLGIGLGTLTKIFLKAFVSKAEISFYLGDKEFDEKFNELLKSKKVSSAIKKIANNL